VAQLGSALDWGSRGRRFKSCQPDRCLALSEAYWGLPRAPRGTYVEQGTNLPPLKASVVDQGGRCRVSRGRLEAPWSRAPWTWRRADAGRGRSTHDRGTPSPGRSCAAQRPDPLRGDPGRAGSVHGVGPDQTSSADLGCYVTCVSSHGPRASVVPAIVGHYLQGLGSADFDLREPGPPGRCPSQRTVLVS
jgi:hypothetical protein